MREIKRLHGRYGPLAGYAFVMICALYASLSLCLEKAKDFPGTGWEDPVSVHERRIEPLKSLLPPRGAVGYVTALDSEKIFARERSLKDVELLGHFILTQYTLAPVFVYNTPDRPLVVGNFIGSNPDPSRIAREGLAPLRDLGDGLILYRRKE
jgi:hypothetical protein